MARRIIRFIIEFQTVISINLFDDLKIQTSEMDVFLTPLCFRLEYLERQVNHM